MMPYRASRAGKVHDTTARKFVSVDEIRAVWAAVTAAPDASLRRLSQTTGINFGAVQVALDVLGHAGYIELHSIRPGRRIRHRRIVVPFKVLA